MRNPQPTSSYMEEKFQAMTLKSVMKKECSLSPLLFNTVFKALTRAVQLEKVIKRMQTNKKGYKQGKKKPNYPILRMT